MVKEIEWKDERRFELSETDNIKVLLNDQERYNFTVKSGFKADIFFRLIEKEPEVV